MQTSPLPVTPATASSLSTPLTSVGTITGLRATLHSAALPRPWGDAVLENHVIEVVVHTSEGDTGTGMSWTPTIGPTAVLALLRDDVAPFLVGRPAHGAAVWDDLWAHLHEAGSGGLTTVAMAGVDLALHDLAARRAGRSVVEHLGRRRDSTPAYGSGVNLHYSTEELVAQVGRWVDSGFDAVKVKVGSPDLTRDVERLREVRDVLGPDRSLMIDANQRWDLPTARRAMAALASFDPAWIEEPLRADDLRGHVALRAAIDVPVALGENAHTSYRFRELIDAGAVDVVQPNIVRVGGITPFLRIAELARGAGLAVAPHLLTDLSAQIAMTLPTAPWVEVVEDASLADLGVLDADTGVVVSHGRITAETGPGLGLHFHHDHPEER